MLQKEKTKDNKTKKDLKDNFAKMEIFINICKLL